MKLEAFKLNSPHIAAEIYYLRPEEGGRDKPIYSGYRGQFYINNTDWDAAQEFIDTDTCQPGETVKAYLQFATVHQIIPMSEGSRFQIREGSRTVGEGVITVIFDDSIRKSGGKVSLYNEIDNIIWDQWDPIGINGYTEARDEYYSYLPHILRLVLNREKGELIAAYLYEVETKKLGLNGNYRKCFEVANTLLAIKL